MTTPQLKSLQIYFIVFYLFGLNSFVSLSSDQKKLCKLLVFLPRIAAILGNVCIVYIECEHLPRDYDGTVLYIFGRSLLITGPTLNLIAIFESLYNVQSVQQILSEISTVIIILKIHLKMEYSHEMLKKSLNRKLAMPLAVITVGSIIKFYVEINTGKRPTISFLWTVSNVFKYIHLFHMLFYIDFIRFALKSLCEKLANKMNDRQIFWFHGQRNELWSEMHSMKSVYFRLWNVSQNVNSLFGWFLVVFMLEMASTVVYNVYWEYVLFKLADDKQVPRKYNLNVHDF